MLVVVDYEAGNLRSVAKALEQVGVRPTVNEDAGTLLQAGAVVLPGVGASDAAMRALRQRGLVEPLREVIARGTPFLGVCMGLELLMESTEEGEEPCLGVVAGRVRRLPEGLKVPHMGWNSVELRQSHPVFAGVPQGSHFYFVHSYYAQPQDPSCVLGTTTYGVPFCSVLARGNLVATQFHPEKSGPLGLKVYENFARFAFDWQSERARRG
ncbi:MAG: imidazole glycerol phosphate synthase subunit HisH [Dehalococcoidia bacterium]